MSQSEQQFADDKAGWAARWAVEFKAAKEKFDEFHEKGKEIVEKFLDQNVTTGVEEERLSLFHSNISTMHSLLYGKTPEASVDRKYADANDIIARASATMLKRVLDSDLEVGADGSEDAFSDAVSDMLLVDMGMVRLRYVPTFSTSPGVAAQLDTASGKTLAEAMPEQQLKDNEEVETLYIHWQDVMWSPCRTFNEMRWCAFKNPMSREDLNKRFGEEVGAAVPLNTKIDTGASADASTSSPWARADVWEVWDKEHRKVDWYVDGYPELLDSKPDPLQLLNFWPFPKPLIINKSTSDFFPCPDYKLHQSQYKSINELTTRIGALTRCVKVFGMYDKSSTGVKDVFRSPENTMIPVDAWAAFAETGGIKGHLEFMPLDQVVGAIDKLREIRQEEVQLLFQVSGMSDIMRGQSSQQATATEQSIKARFASVKIQKTQDIIAKFTSSAQAIKAEIISRWFDVVSILKKSNFQFSGDAAMGIQAAQLIKETFPGYRIKVRPEQVAMTDFEALRQERTGVIMALAQFLQSMTPMLQVMPEQMPNLMRILQWAMAGFKGADEISGIFDQAVKAAQQKQAMMQQQAQKGPPPDPKMQSLQVKGQMDAQHTQQELQADLMRNKAEMQKDVATMQAQDQINAGAERRRSISEFMASTLGGKK